MTHPGYGLRARRALTGVGLALLLAMVGTMPAVPQDNPMAAQPMQADDEPESALPPPSGPIVSGRVSPSPESDNGQRVASYPVHPAPMPPIRPFVIEPAPGMTTSRVAPVTTPPGLPTPPVAPTIPAPAPSQGPAPNPVLAEPAPATPPSGEETRIASLPTTTQPATTREIEDEEEKTPEPMLVEKQTDAVDIACLRPELLRIVRIAGEHFKGTPVITSGQRNRGRLGSYHRKCMAADFFVPGIERARLAKFLRTLPEAGGVGTYCHTKSVHIDIGEPRNWWQCGFRFRFAQR